MQPPPIDPKTLLSTPETLDRIDAACRRHFPGGDGETLCGNCVLDGLMEDDARRLKAFKGDSQFTTFLYSVVNRLAIDCFRKAYGRDRPPSAVSALGEWAETVYRLVCWKGLSFQDAYEIARMKDLFTGSWAQFDADIAPLREAGCPEKVRFESADAAEAEKGKELESDTPNPLDHLLDKLDDERRISAGRIIKETTAEFSEDDQLLVRLVYRKNHTAADAGRALGLNPPAARKRLRKLLTRYREKLLAAGIRKP